MRTLSIVVLDNSDNITDRFDLPFVTSISGLGFELSISKIETDIEDFVTKCVQKKNDLSFKVIHQNMNNYHALNKFISIHINDDMALEYFDNIYTMYCMVKVSKGKNDNGELNEYHVFENTLTLTPLTPFFQIVKNSVFISYSSTGKSYSYKYPYNYGANKVVNNVIENDYVKDIPLIITLTGKMNNPNIVLTDSNNVEYNRVKLDNAVLNSGDILVINSATRKIKYLPSGMTEWQDWFYKIDPTYDSYLRAKALTISSIDINLTSGDTGTLTGSRRQYLL